MTSMLMQQSPKSQHCSRGMQLNGLTNLVTESTVQSLEVPMSHSDKSLG